MSHTNNSSLFTVRSSEEMKCYYESFPRFPQSVWRFWSAKWLARWFTIALRLSKVRRAALAVTVNRE